MINYKLPLLLSLTLSLSACATLKGTFEEGMAFLFDEQPAEAEKNTASMGSREQFEQQHMQEVAQARQVRQQDEHINAFVPKEKNQQPSARHETQQVTASNETVKSSVKDGEVSKVSSIENSTATDRQNQMVASASSEKVHDVPESSPPLKKKPKQPDVVKRNPKGKQSKRSATENAHASGVKPESDESHYAHRGYQEPLRNGFYPRQTHKKVADYASQLAMELMDRAMGLSTDELVGVTSFVRLNTALSDTTILGNQLSEYLINELQAYGVGVIDFKVTDGISITPRGDIAMSRSGQKLAQSVRMDHILTGTMIEDPRGVRINARIVSVNSKRVVASASIHIPAFVVTSLYSGQSSAP